VALKCFVDNWRWAHVPFYSRTGKRLPTRVTEVVLNFKAPPLELVKSCTGEQTPNKLIIRIQPDEGFLVRFNVKKPGGDFCTAPERLQFHYSDSYGDPLPTAYERLLHDVMKGDATLFAHTESVLLCWRFIQPILDTWQANPDDIIYGYPAGTWGPEVMDAFIQEAPGWRYPCKNLTSDNSFCEL
jgi:glucose-6-phosphate 1-dehydrogenase